MLKIDKYCLIPSKQIYKSVERTKRDIREHDNFKSEVLKNLRLPESHRVFGNGIRINGKYWIIAENRLCPVRRINHCTNRNVTFNNADRKLFKSFIHECFGLNTQYLGKSILNMFNGDFQTRVIILGCSEFGRMLHAAIPEIFGLVEFDETTIKYLYDSKFPSSTRKNSYPTQSNITIITDELWKSIKATRIIANRFKKSMYKYKPLRYHRSARISHNNIYCIPKNAGQTLIPLLKSSHYITSIRTIVFEAVNQQKYDHIEKSESLLRGCIAWLRSCQVGHSVYMPPSVAETTRYYIP